MVTSVELAAHLGISQTTVSRVMRGDPKVAPATSERVLEAARKLGYVPNYAARTLVTRRTRAVAVVVADLRSPFYANAIDVIQRRLSERGYRMVLVRDSDEDTSTVDSVDLLGAATVDGTIFVSATRGSRTVRRVLAQHLPVVLLSRDDPTLELEHVSSDEAQAGELVAAHLVELGHRTVGVVSVPRARTNGAAREDGLRDALKRRQLDVADEHVCRVTSHAEAAEAVTNLLSCPDAPTALYCVTDEWAFAAMDAAIRLGLDIPGDLSVVGFDDSQPARWAMINLTSVAQPVEEMSTEAVKLLLDRLEKGAEEDPGHRVFPVTLEVRGTTGPPRSVNQIPTRR